MIKETVTFEDLNGNERTRDYFFNLNEAELMEMELSVDGGLVETINRLVKEEKNTEIIKIFKKLVLTAYGEKHVDGMRFEKSDELRAAFEQSPAYPKIFMKLATDAEAAGKFVNGIIPKDLAKKAASAKK